MATVLSYKGPEIDKGKSDAELSPPVDFNIMEYFYAATMNDILDDDDLVKLINSNGFYKTCFCEAFDLYEVTIVVGTEKFKWTRPQNVERSNLDIFAHLNEKENINDINKYTGKYRITPL